MTYNGRKVMTEVAEKNGWAVISGENFHGGTTSSGGEIVAYERYNTQVLIEWTQEDTAWFIVKNYGSPDQEIAEGPLGLITARGWLES